MGRAIIGFLVYDGRLADLEAAAAAADQADEHATVTLAPTGAAGEYGTPYVTIVETAHVGVQARDERMQTAAAALRSLAEEWEPRDRERARLIDDVKAAQAAAERASEPEIVLVQPVLDAALDALADEGLEVPDGDQ